MPRIMRYPKPGCAYYVPKNKFRATIYFCYSYKELKGELASLSFLHSAKIDGQPRANDISDPTAHEAARIMKIKDKIEIIEGTVQECARDLYPWMIKAVTEEGCTYRTQLTRNIPISEKEYHTLRRKIFFEISQKI